MWQRCRDDAYGRALSAVLFAIGIGSWLFHTHATAWAAAADTTPILAFSLAYIFLSNRGFWNLGLVTSAVAAALYVPYSALATQLFETLPFFEISSFYWPLPTLIFAYAFLLRRKFRSTSVNLGLGAALLCLSLIFRSLDDAVCLQWPLGTHFLWHLCNAVMLGWMIETRRRHLEDTV